MNNLNETNKQLLLEINKLIGDINLLIEIRHTFNDEEDICLDDEEELRTKNDTDGEENVRLKMLLKEIKDRYKEKVEELLLSFKNHKDREEDDEDDEENLPSLSKRPCV